MKLAEGHPDAVQKTSITKAIDLACASIVTNVQPTEKNAREMIEALLAWASIGCMRFDVSEEELVRRVRELWKFTVADTRAVDAEDGS